MQAERREGLEPKRGGERRVNEWRREKLFLRSRFLKSAAENGGRLAHYMQGSLVRVVVHDNCAGANC